MGKSNIKEIESQIEVFFDIDVGHCFMFWYFVTYQELFCICFYQKKTGAQAEKAFIIGLTSRLGERTSVG